MKSYGTLSWIFLEKSQLSKPSVKGHCKNAFREEGQYAVPTASACCVIVVLAHCSRTVWPCLTAKLNRLVARLFKNNVRTFQTRICRSVCCLTAMNFVCKRVWHPFGSVLAER